MASKLTTLLNPSGTPAGAVLLAACALAIPVAGCGGDSKDGKSGTTKTNGGKADKRKAKGPKPAAGSQIKDFKVQVVNPSQAKLSATLAKASPDVSMQVRRSAAGGGEGTKIGKVPFGKKPAGAVTISWNLKVEGKTLVPGRYQLVLRGRDVGKSREATITVPG